MADSEFYLGQVFDGIYPPEAAHWCNDGQKYHIDEIEPNPETGERRFQIVENQVYEPTPEELAEMKAAAEKAKAENAAKLAAVRKMGLTDAEALAVAGVMPFWDEGESYVAGDYVVFDFGKLYRCEKDHTSSDKTVPGNSLGYWSEVTGD